MRELGTASTSKTAPCTVPPALEEPAPLLFACIQCQSSLLLGQDVHLSVEVSNRTIGKKAVHLLLRSLSLQYSCMAITQLWKEKLHFLLKDNQVKDCTTCNHNAV
ncbi:lithostathine-1-like [Platysternon megacephalum]|uniref:Lithostathine-1-like n=1 Tax=Platysternon megacephalum TaxID=55544 RepID=A0A4D9E1Y3_9SAUR|nr:lithostathine-1-like [Platysternon megacephalum]